MRRHTLIIPIAFLTLGACDSPSPRFTEARPLQMIVGDSRYTVRRTEGEAEAIRLGPIEAGGRRQSVLRGLVAIQAATGCSVARDRWTGDAAIIRAELSCANSPMSEPHLDCTTVAIWDIDALGTSVDEIECGIVTP